MSAGVIAASYVAATSGGAAYNSTVLADTPWAFWPMTEDAYDSAIIRNAGSSGTNFTFGATATRGRPALLSDGGYAMTGAGSGNIPTAVLNSIPTGAAGNNTTLEVWVNIPSGNVAGSFLLVGGNNSNGWGVGIGASNFDTAGRTLIVIDEGVAWKVSAYTFTTGVHHVVAVRGSGGSVTVYVDGASVFTTALSSANVGTAGIAIGGEVGVVSRSLPTSVDLDNAAIFPSALSAARVAAHYNGGAGSNAEVAADNPVVWLKLDDNFSAFIDASPNNRSAVTKGALTHLAAGSGPFSTAQGTTFPGGALGYAIGPTLTTSAVTLECWFRIDALDTTNGHWLMGMADAYAGSTTDKNLTIRSDGKLQFHVASGGNQYAISAAAITTGVWHHVVASVGSAGLKIHLDRATVASLPGVTASYSGSAMATLLRAGGGAGANPPNGTAGAVRLALPAIYTSQLSDARADAHYDAAA